MLSDLPEELRDLMYKDATVNHYVMHFLHGDCTYTKMLESLAIHLIKEKQAYFDLAKRALDHRVMPNPIVKGADHA